MRVDLLIENARVITMDAARPSADRFAVLHGRVVGLDEECDGVRARRRVDLGGAVVTPGWNDAHAHSVWFGHTMLETDLSDCAGFDDLFARLERGAAGLGSEEWVIASGFNQMDTGGEYPSLDFMDRATGGRPLWIKHASGHSCLVNRAAIELTGIADAPDIDGGAIVRGADGSPTGRLEETAMSLVQDHHLPAPHERIVGALDAATRQYAREGLTSVTDAGVGGGWIGHSPRELAAYQDARDRRLLRTRMQPMPASDVLAEIPLGEHRFVGLPGGARSGLGDEWVQLGPVKFFLDGSLLGNTARLSRGYTDCPANHGYFQGDVETMRSRALDAARAGWALAMHAVGDEAIDLAIEILRQLRREGIRPPMRHRLEHGGVVTEAQLAALGELGAPIVAQPRFLPVHGDGFRGYIGDERARCSFPLGSQLRHGLPVAGSSDRPVADGAPLAVMQAAVERRTASGWVYGPEERLTAAEALRAYTVGSAEVTGWGGVKGKIAPGYLADWVVLADSPLEVPSSRISQIEVLATVVGGAATFDRAGYLPETEAADD